MFKSLLHGDLRAFARWVGLILVVYSLIPFAWGTFVASPGELYLPYQTNLDDHMVYAAWMRQAQDFHFFFDNRFAVEAQPGLTIHLYFFVLGVISKFLGIATTTVVAKAGLSFAFVLLLAGFIDKMNLEEQTKKLALVIGCFGGGLGAVVWQNFGLAFTSKHPLASLMSNLLPIDVWQPEAFVFGSALTNGLFMASLCLIIIVFRAVLEAKNSWKPVLPGALAMLLLMNIHSYDVVVVAVVMLGTLLTSVLNRTADAKWVTRCSVIALGLIPSAYWFLVVLTNDKVFQHRAATLTYAPLFQQIVTGLIVLIGLAGFAFAKGLAKDGDRKKVGLAGMGGLIAVLYVISAGRDTNQFFLTWPAFAVVLVVALACASLVREDDPAFDMMISWAFAGLILPYLPMLFQRKLGMAIGLPWGILGACGLARVVELLQPTTRRLAMGAGVAVCSVSALMWLIRELEDIQHDVSSTTLHELYYPKDVVKIIDILNSIPGRKVVACAPGQPAPTGDQAFAFTRPAMPDLNPVLSGLSGCYTYGGHWSETPNYNEKRQLLSLLFFQTNRETDRSILVKGAKLDYLVAPNQSAFPNLKLADLSPAGETIYQGEKFSLIKVKL